MIDYHFLKLSQQKKIALKGLGFNTDSEFITTLRPALNNFIDNGLFWYDYNTVGTDAIDTTDANSNNIPDYLDSIIKTFNDAMYNMRFFLKIICADISVQFWFYYM